MDAHRNTAGGRSWRLLFLTAAAALALSSVSHAQQDPRTGEPRQLWPQRPGLPRVLDLQRQPDAAQPPAEFAPNQVLVQFRAGVSDADRAAARAAVRASAEQQLRAPDGRLELMTTPLAVPDAAQILQALPQIEFAEPNWIVRSQAAPNDPYYTNGQLWGMYSDTLSPGNEFGTGASELWARGFTGSSQVYVGVIDHGVDIDHPDLAPNIWTNPFDPVDGVDNDGNGYIDDVHGWDFLGRDNSVYDGSPNNPAVEAHGTHVTGSIGARGRNGVGVAGVNWSVTIVVAKFLGPTSFGFTSDAVLAMNYLIDLKTRHGLDVVAANNSWTGTNYSTALHQATIRAAKSGILVVAAAGNQARDNDATATYPANYDTTQAAGSESPATYDAVISVAAITSSGDFASFSNFGAATVDIAAPGAGIYSTTPQNQYASWNGTSMATAHLTGAVAIYKSMNSTASAEAIRGAVLSHGILTSSLTGRTTTGRRLNVGDFTGAYMTFTDSPLVPGVHHMRAVHVVELRVRVNDLRVLHGLATVAWTDEALGQSVTIKAVHLAELRAAVGDLYVALGQMPPLYTDPTLVPASTAIKAVHITELRAALEALED
jgi:hypothetical protein